MSITNVAKVRLLVFPAASVSVIVLSAYVPGAKALNVTVFSPVEVTVPPLSIPAPILVVTVPVSFVVNT